jgi:hypothetical protein
MSLKCIGCDSPVPWNGEGVYYYTCPCGATVFYDDETEKLALPVSLFTAVIFKNRTSLPLPHIDYYVGESEYTSNIKEAFIRDLLDLGFIWMKDCEQCKKDDTLARKLARDKALAVREAEEIIKNPPEPA